MFVVVTGVQGYEDDVRHHPEGLKEKLKGALAGGLHYLTIESVSVILLHFSAYVCLQKHLVLFLFLILDLPLAFLHGVSKVEEEPVSLGEDGDRKRSEGAVRVNGGHADGHQVGEEDVGGRDDPLLQVH